MAGTPTSTLETTTAHEPLLERIQKRIESLHMTSTLIGQTEESLSRGKSLNKDQLDLLHKKPIVHALIDALKLLNNPPKETSSLNLNENKERQCSGRYLCFSDGFRIFLMDLKHNKDEFKDYSYDLQPFPKSCTLMSFVEEDFPVSMGLFKLGSNAYMVAGHAFPLLEKNLDLSGNKVFHHLYDGDTFKGMASLKTYRLALVDGRPSLSKCDTIKELNKPKFWPIVEKIGSHIHLIESYPPAWHFPPPIPSHEFLNPSDLPRGWIELPPPFLPQEKQFDCYRWYHLAVADRIYATGFSSDHFEVFDSKTNRWELHEYVFYHYRHMYSIKHVSEILTYGFGRCIGKSVHGESSNPLYVVIGVGEGDKGRCAATAYLVTPDGQVLFYQRLPLFFGGFMDHFCGSQGGTVVSVDEEGDTFCAIVPGKLRGLLDQPLLFISTFTVEECPVEECPNVGLLFPSSKAQKVDEDYLYKLPFAVEKYFVNLVVKDWNAYKLAKGDFSECPPRVSACFL